MFRLLLIIILTGAVDVYGLQTITCKDGNLLGIQELVDIVQLTVEQCKSSTSSRVADDGKNHAEKAKEFFEKVHSSKIMNEARELVKKFRTCAEHYADSFSNTAALEENASSFKNCFNDATNKFVDWAKSECQLNSGS
ncbi:unnamed protein product [Allacma fusca]|uniref:Uncharacterized protein n=1 Tax=Allacma fusca TaxID=39272 RepID=A0A8J2LFD0_9HEXA|nr:unnamed protein product [Allacma fusca]